MLGDRFSQGISGSVVTELKGRAQVVWVDPADTSYALAHFEELLGKDKWDIIHFNFGLPDLCYKDPSIKGIRAMSKSAGGVRVTPPELYQRNLIELVRRLKATGAKLIWASMVPTPGLNYDPDSEVEYNGIASRIMSAEKIPVNDLHAFALASAKEKKIPSFQEPTVKAILSQLELLQKK
ncbi:MAG: SGNH/GDSL hydrolase family protein [Verrucomicrobia bacterium]|nr:SGNH/GDSL hydrolase family protein [Verrucomicrobiota bacterium]